MPKLRHRTVRRKISTGTRKHATTEEKLCCLRALYIVVYNGENSIIPQTTELFHLVGDVLEGTPPEALEFNRINRKKVLDTYTDLLAK